MKNSLGKGLQSLIPKKESKMSNLAKGQEDASGLAALKKESIFNVEIDKIRPNPNQPRKEVNDDTLEELAASIGEHGVLQPLIVNKIEKATDRGREVEYELVAGERRWRASRMAGLPFVPVIIRDNSANEKLEVALVENIQRKDLNAIDLALAFKQLQDNFGLKHTEIANKIGKSRPTVTNTVRLLSLPKEIQKAIADNRINEGHGRAIMTAGPTVHMPIFRRIIKDNLSVRRTEELARKLSSHYKTNQKSVGPKNPLFRKLERNLQETLGRRVSITKRGEVGHLRVEFASQKELDLLVSLLLKT